MITITILLPQEITDVVHSAINRDSKVFMRDGIMLEKGAVLTTHRIDKNLEYYKHLYSIFSVYPDLYLKLITPTTSKFRLKFFQIIFLRACLRYGRILTIAPRAAGKSFICILALMLICIFRPGSRCFSCAPGKAQTAKIANQKIHQLWDIFPLLKSEVVGDGNFGSDYCTLTYRNGSQLTVMTPISSTRGNRATAGIIDEYRDHNADDISEIILPLLNVDRPMKNQEINPNEPQQVQMWISSAADKNTFAYDKTIEMLELAIINPQNAFIWGFDYRVPVKTGLLSKDFLNEMKMSSTFSESGFAKEYMSRFVGSSNEAWFDYDKLLQHRKLINPESHYTKRGNEDFFYIIGVDVARRGCQTVAAVIKVFPNGERYKMNLVNLFVLGKTEDEKVFDAQVLELKRLIRDFQPKEVVIDINGLGIGFADCMIKETFDSQAQEFLPSYGFFNRDEYELIQPRKCPKILYGIKANSTLNSEMHSTLYSSIYSGSLNFLISEKKAREKLLGTKVGQRMSPEQKIKRLLPHELTSILISEIMNLKIKPTGVSNQIAVEQINQRMGKDKFSALEMCVYRIIEIQNEEIAHKQNRGLTRQLTFYKKGGGRRKR